MIKYLNKEIDIIKNNQMEIIKLKIIITIKMTHQLDSIVK